MISPWQRRNGANSSAFPPPPLDPGTAPPADRGYSKRASARAPALVPARRSARERGGCKAWRALMGRAGSRRDLASSSLLIPHGVGGGFGVRPDRGKWQMGKRESRALRCTECSYGFVRMLRTTRQRASCPKCKARFDTAPSANLSHAEVAAIRKEAYDRKVARRAALFNGLRPSVETIRASQIPISMAEAAFKAKAMEKGWKPHRPSWPDFLVETRDGTIAVEVKSRGDSVSATQAATFTILESCGIPVFIWRRAKGCDHKLVRWNGGDGLIKLGLRSAA